MFTTLGLSGALANNSCKAQASDKKLAGASAQQLHEEVQDSDAASMRATHAADKKLSGAAKDSFTKKCVKDATGI